MHHASAKVILLGEHAVVHGIPALAGAIAGGATVRSLPGRGLLRIGAWDVTLDPTAIDERPLGLAYRALRAELGLGATSPVDLELAFSVPTGAGLGSSAAMAVAVARALDAAHQLRAGDERLAAAAMASETVIHGRPSGLDHTIALVGGFGLFRRGHGLEPVRAARPLRLVIGHTGRERDTKGRVERVTSLLAEREGEVRERFAAIGALVARGRVAVEQGEFGALGAAMDENQRHLAALECSCPEIDRLCALARDEGAVGAKLTGGGGGGCVIAVAPSREDAIAVAMTRGGFAARVVEVGA